MNDLLNNLIKKYTHNTFLVRCTDVVSDLEELKESLDKKVEVPEFVAKWYIEHEKQLEYSIFEYIYDFSDQDDTSEFYKWFKDSNNKPVETLIRMKDGYKVAKEPKWIVKSGTSYFVEFRNKNFNSIWSGYEYATIFNDKEKAEAVAVLSNGIAVEVEGGKE